MLALQHLVKEPKGRMLTGSMRAARSFVILPGRPGYYAEGLSQPCPNENLHVSSQLKEALRTKDMG